MAIPIGYKGYAKLAEKLSRGTHFSTEEAEALLNMYCTVSNGGRLDINKFRDILHGTFGLTDELMLERVCTVFDRDQDGTIAEDEFILGLSVFLRGTLQEKIEYCFSVYDHNGDAIVAREEILQQIRAAVVNIPPGEEHQEVAKDLVEMILRRLDEDKDGRVSYEDYATSVTSEPLLLEVLGCCLPDIGARDRFLSTFMKEHGRKQT